MGKDSFSTGMLASPIWRVRKHEDYTGSATRDQAH